MSQQQGAPFRVGDEWVLMTNTGNISRTITAVEDGKVSYRGYGDPYSRECSFATFKRWAKGANLEFATDWSGRGAGGKKA